jgi:hypothetical protein
LLAFRLEAPRDAFERDFEPLLYFPIELPRFER